eukprot:286163_1
MPGNELTKVASFSQHVTTDDLYMNTAVIGNGEDELYGSGSNVTKGGGTNSKGEIYEDVQTPQFRTDDGESIYGNENEHKNQNDNDEKMYESINETPKTPQTLENPTAGATDV